MKLGRIKLKDKEEKKGFIGYVIESLWRPCLHIAELLWQSKLKYIS